MVGVLLGQAHGSDTYHAEILYLRIQIINNVSAIYPSTHEASYTFGSTAARPKVDLVLTLLPPALRSVNEEIKQYVAAALCQGRPFIQGPPRADQKAAFEALLEATAELAGLHHHRLIVGKNGTKLEESGGIYNGDKLHEPPSGPAATIKREPTETPKASPRVASPAVGMTFGQLTATPFSRAPFPYSFGGESDPVFSPEINGGMIPVFPDNFTLL